MTHPVSRRDFLAAAAAAGTLASLVPAHLRAHSVLAADPMLLSPFGLERVRLRPGYVADQLEINRKHLLHQDPDRLLHAFRITAGLPSTATPLGGWEAPDNELRGHYTGHYLSALALTARATGDSAIVARSALMVRELATVQDALGSGYLSAFPEELFDRLRAGKPAWAPFYTIHKIMTGLLDTHVLSGNPQAMDVLKRQVTWVNRWVQPLGEEHMARVLEREYGGMNDVLYRLFAVTHDPAHADLAHRFDHERFFAPLAAGRDELNGLHANTNIPKVIGAATRYEVLSDRRAHDIAGYFWHQVTGKRSYCTGGTSNGEGWGELGKLSTDLSGYTQECCVTYNMLKLSRHLFTWTADPAVADYYERAFYNGILGTMHPSDGDKLYYVPLSSGLWKMFGTPEHDYWCCTGSMAESFSKLGDSVYFRARDGVYVNLFVPSELDYKEKGVRLVQDTRFPEEDTTRFTVHTAAPVQMALRIRVPAWAAGGHALLNGKALEGFAAPGSFFVLDRTWRDGDRVEVVLPMSLRVEAMPDDPTMQAIMYGPLVLVGRLGTEGLTPASIRAEPTKPRNIPEYKLEPVAAPSFRAPSDDPASWIERVPGSALTFRTKGQATDVTLVPFYQLMDERYATYWKVTRS